MRTPLPCLNERELTDDGREDDAGFGCLSTQRGCLPLRAMDVRAKIAGLVSHLRLRQTFVNAMGEPLEATYIFPLPDRGAVTAFRMEVSGRVITGQLKERGEARRDYRQAIETGHRAAIAEEERPNVFSLRVGNLLPGEEAVIDLTLTGLLPFADGEATFRFPLVVAPRYIPGVALADACVGDGVALDTDAVPDASRITPPVLLPGFPNPVSLSLTVRLAAGGLPVTQLRSSLHALAEDPESGQARSITLRPGERLDRDFILRFRLAEAAIETSLLLDTDNDQSEEGTFMLTIVPPSSAARQKRPRDVVFILDRSGSMQGWKMVAARRAVARMVDTLTERDRFAVYAFSNGMRRRPDRLHDR